jgi:hypothetical protein
MSRKAFFLSDRLLTSGAVIRKLAEVRQWPLKTVTQINLLTAIRIINARPDINCTFTGIMFFLRANNRSSRKSKVIDELEKFSEAEFIVKQGSTVKIGQYGLNALHEIEMALRHSHYKYRMTDPGDKPAKCSKKKRFVTHRSTINFSRNKATKHNPFQPQRLSIRPL